VYNTNRMVDEYAQKFYIPSTDRWHRMSQSGFTGAKELTQWKKRVETGWKEVHVLAADTDLSDEVKVGQSVHISVPVHLGPLTPADVRVQVLFGKVNADGDLESPEILDLKDHSVSPEGRVIYTGNLECRASGLQGFAVRVLPCHGSLSYLHETGLIRWG
jgi:starch phosphorylase